MNLELQGKISVHQERVGPDTEREFWRFEKLNAHIDGTFL